MDAGAEIATAIAKRFTLNPHVPPSITVRVEGGQVRLEGLVRHYYQRHEAALEACRVPGVECVVNTISVYDLTGNARPEISAAR